MARRPGNERRQTASFHRCPDETSQPAAGEGVRPSAEPELRRGDRRDSGSADRHRNRSARWAFAPVWPMAGGTGKILRGGGAHASAPVVLPCFDLFPGAQEPLYSKPPHRRHPLRRTPGEGSPPSPRGPRKSRVPARRPGSVTYNSVLWPGRLLHCHAACCPALAPGREASSAPVRRHPARHRPALRSFAVTRGSREDTARKDQRD